MKVIIFLLLSLHLFTKCLALPSNLSQVLLSPSPRFQLCGNDENCPSNASCYKNRCRCQLGYIAINNVDDHQETLVCNKLTCTKQEECQDNFVDTYCWKANKNDPSGTCRCSEGFEPDYHNIKCHLISIGARILQQNLLIYIFLIALVVSSLVAFVILIWGIRSSLKTIKDDDRRHDNHNHQTRFDDNVGRIVPDIHGINQCGCLYQGGKKDSSLPAPPSYFSTSMKTRNSNTSTVHT